MTSGKETGAWEYLRIATPVLTTLGLFIIGYVGSSLGGHMNQMETQIVLKIDKLDDKIFKHMTNDEIHVLRSTVVDKAMFDVINQVRVAQIQDIKAEICDVKTLLIQAQQEAKNGKSTSR
jgi:hypothetical protein